MKKIYLRNIPDDPNSPETYNHPILIQHLASWIKPVNYLEIGVRWGNTYNLVKNYAQTCHLVDIEFLKLNYSENTVKYQMTSDKFFSVINPSIQFDLVFIDGDHSKEQVIKDFMNVEGRVIDDGFVILHDTYPYNEQMLQPEFSNNCWEAALWIKENFRNDWEILTLPFNPGLTLMKKMKGDKQLIWK